MGLFREILDGVSIGILLAAMLIISLFIAGIIAGVSENAMPYRTIQVTVDSDGGASVVDFWISRNELPYFPINILGVYDENNNPIPYAVNLPDPDYYYYRVSGAWISGSYPVKYTNTTPSGTWYDLNYDDSTWYSGNIPMLVTYNETWTRMYFNAPIKDIVINGTEYTLEKAVLLIARHGMPLTVYLNGVLLDNLSENFVAVNFSGTMVIVAGENVYWKDITDYIKYGEENLLAWYINLTYIYGLGYVEDTHTWIGDISAVIYYVLVPKYTEKYHIYLYVELPAGKHTLYIRFTKSTTPMSINKLFNVAPYTLYDSFTSKQHFNYSFATANSYAIIDGYLMNTNMYGRANLPIIFNWTYNWDNDYLVVDSVYIPLLSVWGYDVTYRLGNYASYDDVPVLDVDVGDVRYLNEHVYNSLDYAGNSYLLVFSNQSNVSISTTLGSMWGFYPMKIKWYNKLDYQKMVAEDFEHNIYVNEATGVSYGGLVNMFCIDIKGEGLVEYVLIYPYDPDVTIENIEVVDTGAYSIAYALGSVSSALITVFFTVLVIVLLLTIIDYLRRTYTS